MPYRSLFTLLRAFSDGVSQTLTRIIYKFKISFRQPENGKINFEKEENPLLNQSRLMLLEDKRS